MNIPTINLARTGTNIVMLRKAAGLTVHDLQMAFGFNSPQAIYKWQNGTALPTVDNLIALAALLHVRIDDILITDHSVAYYAGRTSPCHTVRSSKWLGHSPFTAAMTGSSPARISIILGYC